MQTLAHPLSPERLNPPPPPPRLRILCVDDEPRVLEGLKLQLRSHYEVLSATGGAQGLEILHREKNIAVVVSDMRMPGTDGASFLRLARDIAPDTARILLTGYADPQAAIDAVNQGQICSFLTKPCSPPALLSALQAAAARYRGQRVQRLLAEPPAGGDMMQATFAEAVQMFACSYAALAVHESTVPAPLRLLTHGLDAKLFDPATKPAPLLDRLLRGEPPVHLRFVDGQPRLEDLPPGHPKISQLIGVALPSVGNIRGWLYFADQRPSAVLCADDIRTATVLARMLAGMAEAPAGTTPVAGSSQRP